MELGKYAYNVSFLKIKHLRAPRDTKLSSGAILIGRGFMFATTTTFRPTTSSTLG